jgi:O-acetyl-ADP-ribose deacetylase (regulator of RNase III)
MSGSIEFVCGDITAQHIDAIVNAANASLYGGGGVDGAIHAAAGVQLIEQCRHLRHTRFPAGLPTGDAVATTGGELVARWVIHTVGPKYWEHPDGGADLLARCHRNAIRAAAQVGATSVAFPAISCGIYGWRPDAAAPIALRAVREALNDYPSVERVRFVLYSQATFETFTSFGVEGDPDSAKALPLVLDLEHAHRTNPPR